jgi:signal transduction histidine kinase/ActR/RegA family two-component response regulator
MTSVERNEERILVLAPTERDAALIRQMLMSGNVSCDICASVEELTEKLKEGIGVGLLTDEALRLQGADGLFAELKAQPPWSDIPFLLLTDPGADLDLSSAQFIELAGERANITLLERPVRLSTFLSVVRSALRARRRQYELRDYLAERRQREQDLRQTQKLESIGVLAGGVAHDFNNLLVGILGNASLAVEILPEDSDARPMLQDVILAGHKAADLTRELLAYSGKGQFVVEPLDLSTLVREITVLIQPSIPRLVRLRLDLDRDLPAIEGDASQLQQLVMNLVINGAEAIGENKAGYVEVTTRLCEVGDGDARRPIPPTEVSPGHYICLEVRDTGTGMDPQTLARIFDPFFTTKFTGRGLGLSAALGIVRGHHAGIEVDSAPGMGAAFRIYFPTVDGRQLKVKGDRAHEDLRGAGLILLVDDEEVVRSVARSSLERYGYHVVTAQDGRDGVETFRRHSRDISLVILDITMPVMSGEDALNEIQALSAGVKVMLSSGYNEADAIRRFSGRGLVGFIQKPYTAAALARKVKAALNDQVESAQI